MNLFKKIWTKNFLKAKEPIDKFSDDIGGINGQFSWIKYQNGQKVDQYVQQNQITNLSKSTVIRLLAQGSNSYWRGQIDPSQYSISRIRFGNAPYANHNDDLNLCYYNISEISNRNNSTSGSEGEFSPAGGRFRTGSADPSISGPIPSQNFSSVSVSKVRNNTNFPTWTAGSNIDLSINPGLLGNNYDDYVTENPPSHKTLNIELLNSSNIVLARINYGTIYSRYSNNDVGNVSSTIDVNSSNVVSATPTHHDLKYESPVGTDKGFWRVRFKLGSGSINDVATVKINFKIGSFNIINSIVPKTGYNKGIGKTQATRYPLGTGSNRDYYDTVAPIYSDSISGSFIDDYSATFSITMTQTEGNGSANLPVYYTEAFLFNSKDDLFSIIRFPYPAPTPSIGKLGFEKDSTLSYLISWTIKSIL
jgi:hypothetical protein